MIRNRRTRFAVCINSEETLTVRSTVPRLAGPVVDDTAQFRFPTDSPDSLRRLLRLLQMTIHPGRLSDDNNDTQRLAPAIPGTASSRQSRPTPSQNHLVDEVDELRSGVALPVLPPPRRNP
jgi:hypothetical protein